MVLLEPTAGKYNTLKAFLLWLCCFSISILTLGAGEIIWVDGKNARCPQLRLTWSPPFLLTQFSVAAPCACAYCSSQLHTLVFQRLSRSGWGSLHSLPRQLAAVCPCAAAYPECFNLAADFGGYCWQCTIWDCLLPTRRGSMRCVLVIAGVFVISLISVSSFLLTLSFPAVLWGGGHGQRVGAPAAHFQSPCVFIFLLTDSCGSWSVAPESLTPISSATLPVGFVASREFS